MNSIIKIKIDFKIVNSNVSGDGREGNCTDIDECLSTPCDSNATCSNFPGSYNCTCNSGYHGDGFTCANIDECDETNPHEVHTCDQNATCSDLEGTYNCTCDTGYSGDGWICTDNNECILGGVRKIS